MDAEFVMNHSRGENDLIFFKEAFGVCLQAKILFGEVWGGDGNGIARQAGSPKWPSPPLSRTLTLATTAHFVPLILGKGKTVPVTYQTPEHLCHCSRVNPSLALNTYWLSVSLNSRSCPFCHSLLILLQIRRCPVQPTDVYQSPPRGRKLGFVTPGTPLISN